MSIEFGRLLMDSIDEGNSLPTANPYTTAGLIVWYCLIILSCIVLPLVCLLIWYFCQRYRDEVAPVDDDDDFMDAAEGLDLQILRIEANVDAYSEIEKSRKKVTLLKVFDKQTEVSRGKFSSFSQCCVSYSSHPRSCFY